MRVRSGLHVKPDPASPASVPELYWSRKAGRFQAWPETV